MKYCCWDCFTDTAIREMIVRENIISSCSFCHSDEKLCIDPKKLTGLFELVLGCIQENADGDFLYAIYTNSFHIISDSVIKLESLITSVMGENYNHKKYVLLDGITEYKTLWESFKNHLIKENRFFPTNSLFKKSFK